jgi:UDP-glucose:(heptosyl)LPS alpha-1,3-glucosyltransferase
MKFAFCLFKYFPFGGLSRDFRAIVETLISRGHQVDIYTLRWEGDLIAGASVIPLKRQSFINYRAYQHFSNFVDKELSQKNYDVIIGFNKIRGLDVYYAADPCYQLKSIKSHKKLHAINPRHHGLQALEEAVFHPMLQTHILALCDNQIRDFYFAYHTPKNRFHLLPPWIDFNKFSIDSPARVREAVRARKGVVEDEKLVLLVGSGFKTKGLDRAIIAIASLPLNLREKVKFFVIGQDDKSAFEKLARKYHIEKNIIFLGGRTDVPDFLVSADILLHPAYSENTGNVLLEAIVSGLPLIVTAVCGFASHVQASKAGIVIPTPFKQTDLNKALLLMLTDENAMNGWREHALNYAKTLNFKPMPQVAADFIESVAKDKKHSKNSLALSKNFYIAEELQDRFHGEKAFDEVMQLQGEVYRQLDGRKTLAFIHNNERYFAKLHQGVGWREIFKNLLRGCLPVISAKNEFLAIKSIDFIGLKTMDIVGFGERGYHPAKKQSFLITRALEKTISLEDYTKTWRSAAPSLLLKRRLIDAVASITKKMHDNGINHRDYYICHLLLDSQVLAEKNEICLYMIDLHRAQIRQKIPFRWRVKDIAGLYYSVNSLGLTRFDYYRFIKRYYGTSLKVALKDQRFWQAVLHKQSILLNKTVR